jgi:hypothetical protein
MEIVIETLVLWSLLETPKRNAYVEEKRGYYGHLPLRLTTLILVKLLEQL